MDWTFAWRRRRISRELVVHPDPRRRPRKPAFAVVGIVVRSSSVVVAYIEILFVVVVVVVVVEMT